MIKITMAFAIAVSIATTPVQAHQDDIHPSQISNYSKVKCKIYFEYDSLYITPEADVVIHDIATELAQQSPERIIIHGHADRLGTARYNRRLSKKRSRIVAIRLLEITSYPAKNVQVTWYGEDTIPYQTEDNVPEPLNRCVGVDFINVQ